MPSHQFQQVLTEAETSLERLATFDVQRLVQEAELGAKQNFREAIPYASRAVAFARLISKDSLKDIPEAYLSILRDHLNSVFNTFEQILKYSPEQGPSHRQQYINQVESAYVQLFRENAHILAFSIGRTADFKRLENEGRAAVQLVKDQTDGLVGGLRGQKEEAQKILDDVRKVAAEHGVSQQAFYFKEEAESHQVQSEAWRIRTLQWSIVVALYAAVSVFLHKLPWIAPTSVYETIQLAISKILIFGVLSFLVYLSAKNFMAHKHNAIINKHRQNGLMTFKALVDAGGTPQTKEIVLTHAASAIYAPQGTGYSSDSSGDGPSSKSIVELAGSALTGGKG